MGCAKCVFVCVCVCLFSRICVNSLWAGHAAVACSVDFGNLSIIWVISRPIWAIFLILKKKKQK